MKKVLYVLMLSVTLSKAQQKMLSVGKVTFTDYDFHYCGSVNLSSYISSSVFYFTKRPLISGLSGAVASFFIGYCKEEFFDTYKSKSDLDGDGRGSTVGGLVSFAIQDTYLKRKLRIDTLYYNFNTLTTLPPENKKR